MWLIYIDENNIHPLGSDGAMLSSAKSLRYLRRDAQLFLCGRAGHIYGLHNWTQRVCELGMDEFVKYVLTHGQLLI